MWVRIHRLVCVALDKDKVGKVQGLAPIGDERMYKGAYLRFVQGKKAIRGVTWADFRFDDLSWVWGLKP